jgi:SAM-dependent methyltransferase
VSTFQRLSLAVRKRLPYRVRHILRLGKHLVSSPRSSAWIPASLLTDCRVCASREDLVGMLPRGGRVAEVGTQRGDFARHILAACQPGQLHVIDLDFSAFAPDIAADKRVVMHNGLSHMVLQQFPDAHFDWIYIDADHSYAGVSRDAQAAASKVKPGGYLVFNDFAHMDPELGAYGVHRAVVDFALASRWSFSWLAYQPSALYDVALRRPAD